MKPPKNMIGTTRLCSELGLHIHSDFLKEAGLTPDMENNSGIYWATDRFPQIAEAVVNHLARKLLVQLPKTVFMPQELELTPGEVMALIDHNAKQKEMAVADERYLDAHASAQRIQQLGKLGGLLGNGT